MDGFPARSPMPLSSHLFSLFVILFSLLMRCCLDFLFPKFSFLTIGNLVKYCLEPAGSREPPAFETRAGFLNTLLVCLFARRYMHMTPALRGYKVC